MFLEIIYENFYKIYKKDNKIVHRFGCKMTIVHLYYQWLYTRYERIRVSGWVIRSHLSSWLRLYGVLEGTLTGF